MAERGSLDSTGWIVAGICAVAILAFALAGWAWWRHVYNDPQRAFWSMLSTSLSTSSVTRHTTQADQSNSLDQITRLSLGDQTIARGLSIVKQPSAVGTNTVVTETLGTSSADYARYLSIDTKQTGHNGQPLNLSSVLNVWGKSDAAPAGQPSNTQFLNGTILSLVPFAPLGNQPRQRILQTMRDNKVYDIDYSKAISRKEAGRPVFVYQVSVKPSDYVTMLKTLAHELGLSQLDTVNPAAYASNPPEKMEMSVDKLSHQLVRITYATGFRQETYSGYGLQSTVAIPSATIPISQLQARLQAL